MNQRERTDRMYNLDLIDYGNLSEGFFEMPVIKKEECTPNELLGFNYVKTSEPSDKVAVHCFLDDYQIERLWRDPQRYIDVLKPWGGVFSPDYSLYLDMPLPMKIWNVYRSRFIGAYWQRQGIKVIPTLSWAGPDTFEFCFDGLEKGGTYAISSVGVCRRKESREIYQTGLNELINVLEPKLLIQYGNADCFEYRGVKTIIFKNTNTKKWEVK